MLQNLKNNCKIFKGVSLAHPPSSWQDIHQIS